MAMNNMTSATMTNKPIRAVIFNHAVCTNATLAAFNELVSSAGEAQFLLVADGDKLVIEHPNAKAGHDWCQAMNQKVFPPEIGVGVGSKDDSAPKALGVYFRFPESFYHLVCYIVQAKVFYNPSENTWEVAEESLANKEGCFERGHKREIFVNWMRRQISRLEYY